MKSNGKTLKANRKNSRIVLRGRLTRGFYSAAMELEGKGIISCRVNKNIFYKLWTVYLSKCILQEWKINKNFFSALDIWKNLLLIDLPINVKENFQLGNDNMSIKKSGVKKEGQQYQKCKFVWHGSLFLMNVPSPKW